MTKKTENGIIFKTQVQQIGSEAKDFKEIKMVILFGLEAPEALKSSCYIIDVNPVKAKIKKGMYLQIDSQEYLITAVGSEVQNNLGNLGHIAINFDGSIDAKLPGTMYVENAGYPDICVGSSISIVVH